MVKNILQPTGDQVRAAIVLLATHPDAEPAEVR